MTQRDTQAINTRKILADKGHNISLEIPHEHAETCNKTQSEKHVNTQSVKRLEARYKDSIAINTSKILTNKGQNTKLDISHEHDGMCNKNLQSKSPRNVIKT